MPHAPTPSPARRSLLPPGRDIGFAELVVFVALLMALAALSIDIMLPALPAIAGSFAVAEPNDRQLIVTAYLVGFALGQPFHGPLSDRFGRKPVLIVGLLVYALGLLGAILAPSFGVLLAARAVQGLGSGAPRVVAVAIVRDRFAGRDMARVMSFAMTVFILVPILAPSIGEGIIQFAEWHWIFGFLLLATAVALALSLFRLPETQDPADRVPLSPPALGRALVTVVTDRVALGYTIASGFLFGGLLGYVGSAQQVFVDVFGLGALFPLVFGAVAATLALASVLNARLVGRLGMRRLSHWALLGYVAGGLAMALVSLGGTPPLPVFVALLGIEFFCFGLMGPNFGAMSMEKLGHVAGMASSLTGFYMTAAGALFGWAVGQSFDGTTRPLAFGFAVFGILTLATVLATEGGVLFRSRHAVPAPAPTAGE